jgi:hypothetical protein
MRQLAYYVKHDTEAFLLLVTELDLHKLLAPIVTV